MNKLTFALLVIVFTGTSFADNVKVQTDVSFGYTFLSSEDNPYFRNHYDLSEGSMLENLKVSATSNTENSWFDTMLLEARAGDRFDTGRVIRFSLKKTGRYSFTLKQTWNKDYFGDASYNYGANDRDLTRNNISAEFRWTGFQHVSLIAGYGLSETTGTGGRPFTQWLDVYSLKFDQDTSRESYTAGLDYTLGSFKLMLRQSWVTVTENSQYKDELMPGAGLSGYTTTVSPTRTGESKATIPVSKVNMEYNADRWWTSFSYMHSDADIDSNITDLKSYMFTDAGSRSDFLTALAGTSTAPIDEVGFDFSIQLGESFYVTYDLGWRKMETESSMDTTKTMMLYGTGSTALVTQSLNTADGFYYKNRRLNHGLSFKFQPNRTWDIELKLRRTDGNLMQNTIEDQDTTVMIDDDYSTDRVELQGKYHLSKGNIKASVFHESIDDPTFRTAGDKRDGFTVAGDWMLTDTISWNVTYQEAKLKNNDPTIQLNHKTTLFDTGLQFTPTKSVALGVGYTVMDLDFSNLLIFSQSQAETSSLEAYLTKQKGAYGFASFTHNRFKGRISLYYLDDTGQTFPLTNWNATASCQYRITDSLFGLVSLRYYDYNEDNSNIRDYNVNQLAVGIRWLIR